MSSSVLVTLKHGELVTSSPPHVPTALLFGNTEWGRRAVAFMHSNVSYVSVSLLINSELHIF